MFRVIACHQALSWDISSTGIYYVWVCVLRAYLLLLVFRSAHLRVLIMCYEAVYVVKLCFFFCFL